MDNDIGLLRCGNCGQRYAAHMKRREAAPLCMDASGAYRPGTEAELEAFYRAAFPDGPVPIATFNTNDPAQMERAKDLLNPSALAKHFGPGGGGMDSFEASIKSASLTPPLPTVSV